MAPGASQLQGTVNREMPTKETTGAGYFTPAPPPTIINNVTKSKDFVAYAANSQIITNVTEPGTLTVYDISGRCLHQQKMMKGLNSTTLSANGMFILRFTAAGGDVLTKKIVY